MFMDFCSFVVITVFFFIVRTETRNLDNLKQLNNYLQSDDLSSCSTPVLLLDSVP